MSPKEYKQTDQENEKKAEAIGTHFDEALWEAVLIYTAMVRGK